ncbi:MAG: redoxin domain-containing protein [Candidatus Sulfotelmatobacter sp.]|jgi:peroxiredoxin
MTADKFNAGATQEFGQPLPGFSLLLLNGRDPRTLQDYLTHKMGAVIIFWSAVCAHCRRYDEYFNSFATLHSQLGFAVIASRSGETPSQMQSAARQRRLVFPVLLDQSGEVARRWHAQQTPRSYLMAPDGRLVYRGAIDNFKLPADEGYIAFLEPAIRSYLAGQPITKVETASFGCAIETAYYHLPRQL